MNWSARGIRQRASARLLGRWLGSIGWFLVAASALAVHASDDPTAYFENHIRPVLVESCYGCHSAESGEAEGALLLDSRAGLERGGNRGPIVVPGDPAASRLMQAMEYNDASLQMPPDGKLPDEVLAKFREWIASGAHDPREGVTVPPPETIDERAARHWAYQPVQRPAVPEDAAGWSRRPLDRLVLAKLREQGFEPASEASPRDLLRRVYYGLTGLPPSFDEFTAFAADTAPDAYERAVDRLLATPQFAECWTRHWLDVARFADTKGYVFTEDRTFPAAYRYRDWVIAAIDRDLPINEFFQQQLAADLLPSERAPEPRHAAHGFVTLGRRFINNQPDIVADRIDVVFRGMMGVTVACARCHDHKYDPVTSRDYYALYGIFDSSREVQDPDLPLRLAEADNPHDMPIFVRGNPGVHGEVAPRGVPVKLASLTSPVSSGSGRMQLAIAVTHPQNPLTARVFVNRVWGHLMGQPLVNTPSDFGVLCPPPTQQAVLDLLAADFVANGWSLKWLVREIVTSSTYRQTSTVSEAAQQRDPENSLWSHYPRRRLDFEALRDSLLDSAGRLDRTIGGPSEDINQPTGGVRRTLYAHIDRQNLPGVFRTFDFAPPDAHCPERAETLVPQQALYLLNSPFVQSLATTIAEQSASDDPEQRISVLYRRILRRDPLPQEIELAQEFLRTPPIPIDRGWVLLAQTLLVSNEFTYLD